MRKRKEETANGRRPKKPETLTSFYGQKIANVGWETPYAPISFYSQPMKATAGGGWAETPHPISFYRQPMKAIANGGWLGTLYAPKGFYGQQTEVIANSGCVERPDHLMGFYGEEEKTITDGCGWEEAPYRRQKKKTGNGEWEGASKSLLSFFREQKKISTTANDSETPNVEEEKQGKGGFFACYLLVYISSRGKGRTYIGFTMDPRRRIRQHNGEIGSGARSRRCGRPWEMVLCVYGFPTKVDALKFEWAWQNPKESTTVCEAAAAFKSLDGVANKIKLVHTMLSLRRWASPNIVVHYFSTQYEQHSAGCPELPEQMVVQVGSMDDLPCYTSELRSWVHNKEEGDERGVPDHSQPLDSLLPMMAASPASSQSMEDFNHGGDWSITNETEDDEELPPVKERLLISSYKKLGQFEENRDAKTLTKELPYATDVMQDFVVPPPLRERLLAASYEKFRQLVEREETDQTHSLGPSGSQLPTKSSDLTSLPPIGSAVVNLTEIESLTGTAVTNEAPAPCELRTCSNEKHLATEAAVDEESAKVLTGHIKLRL